MAVALYLLWWIWWSQSLQMVFTVRKWKCVCSLTDTTICQQAQKFIWSSGNTPWQYVLQTAQYKQTVLELDCHRYRRKHQGDAGDASPPRNQSAGDANVIRPPRFWPLKTWKRQNFVPKYTKIQFFRGSAPNPAGGAHSAPPDPLAGGEGARCPLPKNPTPALSHFLHHRYAYGHRRNLPVPESSAELMLILLSSTTEVDTSETLQLTRTWRRVRKSDFLLI